MEKTYAYIQITNHTANSTTVRVVEESFNPKRDVVESVYYERVPNGVREFPHGTGWENILDWIKSVVATHNPTAYRGGLIRRYDASGENACTKWCCSAKD